MATTRLPASLIAAAATTTLAITEISAVTDRLRGALAQLDAYITDQPVPVDEPPSGGRRALVIDAKLADHLFLMFELTPANRELAMQTVRSIRASQDQTPHDVARPDFARTSSRA